MTTSTIRLTPARRAALEVLRSGPARYSNLTTTEPRAVYWQSADWLLERELAFKWHDGPGVEMVELNVKGEALLEPAVAKVEPAAELGSAAVYSEDVATDRVEPVGAAEIAERLGVKRQTVNMWQFRGLLPASRWVVSGAPAWNWPDVKKWAKDSGRL